MLPLEGLIVVSVEQAVAAPFCSSRLADAGAHVIKVERPEGDFARGYDAAAKGQSSYFVWLNRGKNSVVVDLATKDGRAELEELIASADVLLQNLKPGSMDKLGFSLERLRKDYPALICCTISGYGDDGPYADRKAYDLLIQAESGLASITGGPEGPSRVGISVVDIATGATAHASILEALIARGRTGKGADIRISMFDVMADWMAVPLINSEAGNPPKRMALAHPSIAPYGVFNSKDGKGILISIQSEREWKKLCAEVLDQPDLPNDPRFANMVERVRNRSLTDKTVADSFAAMTRVELLKRLDDADIAFAEVNTMADLAVHPHLRRIEVDTPKGKVSYAAPAAIFVGEDRHYGAVPAIGEHAELPKAPRAKSRSHDPSRRKTRPRPSAPMDRPQHGSVRHRHRATREGFARDAVPGHRRAEGRRRRAVDHALVPGAAGVSDVDARPRRPPDPRRLPAAGAAAAPDVGRRRDRVSRTVARRR